MDMDEIRTHVAALPGVRVQIAGEGDGSPESAWGDTFFFHDPDGHEGETKMPFATIVASDYPGFDEQSNLDRPGVFRLNVSLDGDRFDELVGTLDLEAIDFTAADVVFPHPVYGAQHWVSVVNPGPATDALVRDLLTESHARAARRHGTD